MSHVANVIDHVERRCKAQGVRLTNKRKQVLSGLLCAPKALSAYELISYCKAEFDENIPAMSVYRILDFFQDEQLVHKLNLANKYVACTHITCNHKHGTPQFLICGQCQTVKEISIDESTIAQLKQNVQQAGFYLRSPQLEMNCICEACIAD